MRLRVLTTDEKIAEIRRLYFAATSETINQDLAKALELLKSLGNEDERERATVYMHGLNEMRAQWALKHRKTNKGAGKRDDG